MDEDCDDQGTEECPGLSDCNGSIILEHNCVEHIDPFIAVFWEWRVE